MMEIQEYQNNKLKKTNNQITNTVIIKIILNIMVSI